MTLILTRPRTFANAKVPAGGEDGNYQAQPRSFSIATERTVGPDSSYYPVIFHADALEDIERVRVAEENRYRTLVRTDDYGKHFPEDHPLAVLVRDRIAAYQNLETQVTKQLEAAVKDSPLRPFVEEHKGVGYKTLGRFIKEVGDPAWNGKEDRPRLLRELYAYCGLHVVDGAAPHRKRGVKANWSAQAKTRLWLLAKSQVMSRGSFRGVYDDARLKYEDRLHDRPCQICAGAGRPAEAAVGVAWKKGHQQAAAYRLVMKALLRDLHEHTTQHVGDSHLIPGGVL